MIRYIGSYNNPDKRDATGIWSLSEQCDYEKKNSWPKRIITDNLDCWLDAGDSNSYSGSGTTWSDLTSNGNDATLVGSPSWNGESFRMTSDSTYVTLNSYSHRTNDFTYNLWIQYAALAQTYRTLFENGSFIDSLFFRLINSVVLESNAEGVGAGSVSWLPSTSIWYNICVKRESNLIYTYVNGSQVGSTYSMTSDINISNLYTYLMRSQHTTSQNTDGYISVFMRYTDALTEEEIIQNYQAYNGVFIL